MADSWLMEWLKNATAQTPSSVGVVPRPRQTPSDSTVGWSDGGPGIWDLDQGRIHAAWFSHQSLPLLETYSRRGVGFSLCHALSQGLGSAGQNRTTVSDVLRFLRCERQRNIYVPTPVTELQLTAPSSRLSRNFQPKFIFMVDRQGHTPVYVRRNTWQNAEQSFDWHAGVARFSVNSHEHKLK